MNETRNGVIIRTSIIGILVNVLLSGFKLVVGLASNSIAITLDAVNNIADAASSIITIIGTKLAGREPDKKHPFGYGRVEYFTALVIGVIVLYAGISSLTESVKSILHPETPEYTAVSLVIVAVGVAAKVLLGRYFVAVGKKVDSGSLVGSGEEATLDSVVSLSTLIAAGIFMAFHISLEPYLAAVIAVVIIKSGFDMLRETISRLLGERADAELAQSIKETIRSFEGVNGAYDLVLNDYGPDAYQGSVHIEVEDTVSVSELDTLIRRITYEVYGKHHVILAAIGVYALNTKDPEAVRVRQEVAKIALAHEHVKQVHGFYLDHEEKSMRFDIVISFDAADRRELFQTVVGEIQRKYPEYQVLPVLDIEYTGNVEK